MKNILNTIKSVPTWEKVVIVTLFVIPVPLTCEAYFVGRTMYNKMKKHSGN